MITRMNFQRSNLHRTLIFTIISKHSHEAMIVLRLVTYSKYTISKQNKSSSDLNLLAHEERERETILYVPCNQFHRNDSYRNTYHVTSGKLLTANNPKLANHQTSNVQFFVPLTRDYKIAIDVVWTKATKTAVTCWKCTAGKFVE